MATSPKERFDAAVKVIHGLPKNGPFQPSYEMMLNFYGCYKQATEGPCTKPKPWAWDVVAKKKWDAWTKLGDMNREQAMTSYVEELKKIVETMPQDQVVRDFMVKLEGFYEVVDEKMPTSQDVALEGVQENLALDHSMRVDIAHQLEENDPMVASPENLNSKELEESLGENEALADQNQELTDVSILTNGVEIVSTNSGQGDSESEEEFCDTSDHPSQDSESPPHEIEQMMSSETVSGQMSTPIKSNKAGNHVHFSNSMTVHSGHQIIQEVMSPISKSNLNTNEQLNIPASFPFHSVNSNMRQLSDSMLTHGASPGSQNVSMESVSDSNYLDRSSSSLEDSSSGQVENIGAHDNFKTATGKGQGRSLLRNHSQQTGTETRTGLFMAQGGAGEPIPRVSSSGGRGQEQPQSVEVGGDQLNVTLMQLQQDMNRVLARLDSVESAVLQNRSQGDQRVPRSIWNSKWWPFPSLTGRTFFFVFIWPFVVHWLLTSMFRRRRQNR